MVRLASSVETRAALRVGARLGGKYRIERLLGVGGMAAVYEAVHRNGNRVAIKVLHAELSVHDDVRARFTREGYIANAVGHPGTVRVLDDDVAEDGSAFLVMELLVGESLAERRARAGGQLPCREVVALGHQLLDALAAAHERGVLHRDLKPDNLFLTQDRALKILDFGIARVRDAPGVAATRTGARLGTPAFMPPEQALGRTAETDNRSDLWAVGATLFKLISGRTVHEAETSAEVVVRAATTPARALTAVAPEVPAAIAAVIDRALRFRREDRWPSASAMRRALEEAYEEAYGEPIEPGVIAPPPAKTEIAPPSATVEAGVPAASPATAIEPCSSSPSPARPRDSVSTDPGETTTDSGVTTTDPGVATIDPAETREPVSEAASGAARPAPAPEMRSPPSASDRRRGERPARLWGLRAALLALVVAAGAAGVWGARARAVGSTSAALATPAGAEPGGAPTPRCTESRACVAANNGAPAICRKADGVCVPLASEDCRVLAGPGDVENDATVWFGAMYPAGDPDPTNYGPRAANDVELGRRDFAAITGGLLPARAGGPRRPIAAVLCDDRQDPLRAARHLVDEVRVPVVLGFSRSKEVLDLADALFLPRGVLALASNTAAEIRDIPRGPGGTRLVWRVTTTFTSNVGLLAALLADVVEPEIRAAPGVFGPGERIRVAVVRTDNISGRSTADLCASKLRYNGRSVAENGADFRQIVIPDTGDTDAPADIERAAADVVAYRPHVLIQAGTSASLILATERRWPRGERFRPRYLRDTGYFDDSALVAEARDNPDLRRRVMGVDAASDDGERASKFMVHYNEVFSPRMARGSATSAPYDAFYLAAYAAAALGDQPIQGLAMARAISRLTPPGERVEVGPSGIYRTLHALAEGRSIDLEGIQTSLDFDPVTGDPSFDAAVFCLAPDGGASGPRMIPSGLVFLARDRKLAGSGRCR